MVSIATPSGQYLAQRGLELVQKTENAARRTAAPKECSVRVGDLGPQVATLRRNVQVARRRVEAMKRAVESTPRTDADFAKRLKALHLQERVLFSCQLELDDFFKQRRSEKSPPPGSATRTSPSSLST